MNRMKWGLTAAVGVLGALPFALGAAYQTMRTRKDDELLPGLGDLISVDGRTVHVRRMGGDKPGPTVVFESGLSSPLEMWSWIQSEVAESAPTISYDRAGIGWSQPGSLPRTAERISGELNRLLEVLEVSGPLVLVGHSYGGMLLRDFARRYADRIVGVVLVDSAHPEQLERSVRQRMGLPVTRMSLRSGLSQARFGLSRLRGTRTDSPLDQLGEVELATTVARTSRTQNWKTSNDELEAWLATVVDEVRDASMPEGVPLYVLSAGETERSDPMHGELQRELCALSSAGVHHTLTEQNHLGMLCSPAAAHVVAAAVVEVLDAARMGRAPKTVDVQPTGSQS